MGLSGIIRQSHKECSRKLKHLSSGGKARGIIPYAVLGVLLAYVGVEHFRLGWAVPDGWSRALAFFTAGTAIVFAGNLAIGAAFGLGAAALVWLVKRHRHAPAEA